jgi:glycyl-tRNA synthetase
MAKQAITFQQAVMRLHEFWAAQGCVIWNPYNIQVGAGTMNPATTLKVLGPEPWNVGYVEPSIRPDDGRYGDNPNRMQKHHQYQVILKPDPGNPQEIYLQSLEALGIDRREHDIRFVEDNWESPALGAWGLGWEVWLDGQEITQYTYFQQAGGQTLNPVPVELTYGIDRIVLALQRVDSVWDIEWMDGLTYGELFHRPEREHCVYYFEIADVDALTAMYNTYERESERALAAEPPLVLPAYDYLLKCSHTFNVLDTRGAVGVVERAEYFRRMQRLAAQIAGAYVDQRKEMAYPMLPPDWSVDPETDAVAVPSPAPPKIRRGDYPTAPAPFLLEIGSEELPAADLDAALAQLRELVPALLEEARLDYDTVTIYGTPRRQVVYVEGLAPQQRAEETVRRGPPVKAAFDAKGNPTKAAEGFARSLGIEVADLERREVESGEYVVALVKDEGKPTAEVLSEALPGLVAAIRFEKSMRWNWSGIAYSRPIRWLVALFGEGVVPFVYADTYAGRTTRGTRPLRSPRIELPGAADYFAAMAEQGIIVDRDARQVEITEQIAALAAQAGGQVKDDPDLLDEVTNLVEQPTALMGRFGKDEAEDAEFLKLPGPVLTTVMRKHQRYFAVEDKSGNLLPCFIAVRNGDDEYLDNVVEGNEHVIRARFADARFFYQEDVERPLSAYLDGLKGLTFQEDLGSYYEKAARLEGLAGRIGGLLGITDDDGALDLTIRAARLAKADLMTKMVVEMTSLQGIMGREYALLAGENPLVAEAIAEHYLPRSAGGALPQSPAGIAIALADRLDSLVGLFAVGMAPTGSADPFGLRRAALGVVQILLGHGIDIDLRQAVEWAAQGYTRELGAKFITEEAKAAALEFIAGRLRVVLRESYRHDVVEAVLAEQGHNPYQAARYAGQLAQWVERGDWAEILDAYARCARITRGQAKTFPIKPDRLQEVVEKELHVGYEQALQALGDRPDVDTFLAEFDRLVAPITAFFAPEVEGGVLVMAEDKALRKNRLALLQAIVALADGVADFSQMEGF